MTTRYGNAMNARAVSSGAIRAGWLLLTGVCLLVVSCTPPPAKTKPAPAQPSQIKVDVKPGGPIVLITSSAEFQILPSGYIQASLLKAGQKVTLDEPREGGSDFLVRDGKEVPFALDFGQAKVQDCVGKLGRGKRVEIAAGPVDGAAAGIQRTLRIEVYDDFPTILLSSAEYKNTGAEDFRIDRVVEQRHRFSGNLTDKKAQPYDMWSFHGSSYDWGTASAGEALGHVETLPLTLSLPVRVGADGVEAGVDIAANTVLKPGESYSTPRSFVAVYAGDFYEPLHAWSSVLQKEGWEIPKPSSEAYNVSWCGWGYEFNVTPAQMLGTVPKLKELGIKWATLDDRWFDTYGDWNPRADTFPGDSIKKMTDDFHKQGILVQLWWLPLGVEDGQSKYESHKYVLSKVAEEHPEWLILDKDGKHARMTRDLATLCPAVAEVQQFYKKLTEKFIGDWGFDGSKLDNIYSVPMCYNPAHHHKSPQDSVNAMGDVYKTIFQTSRALKPESVTQSCPCGTPPSLAWLPFIDQAVTADPVGAVQVRRRIKMYKALLGPESAVYGDHVELSAMDRIGNNWREHGEDFASTIGAGGVVGTKFVWPDPGPKFKPVTLTQSKEEHWKKWIGIYNQKMLSKGTFRNLYVYGYDAPEGYAIEKDGRMFYAFFAPSSSPWKGEIELRGLEPGSYHVTDYAEGKDVGTVKATAEAPPRLKTEFKDHLLLELSR